MAFQLSHGKPKAELMTPKDFAEVDRIFQHACDLPEEERGRYLDQACASAPHLRAEVESLLSSMAHAETDVEEIVSSAIDSLEAHPFPNEVGSEVGSFILVREIGRGGMATVYQAIRQGGDFLQSVAVKILRRGMDSTTILNRFRAERQILANLNHPHIAALIDGGTTEDGRPYLVMELIEGESVVQFVHRRNLPVKARLELFRNICAAVEYAHQSQVIHRDIKPGNVLVTPDGVPKLLDFGIAKVLMPEIIPDAPNTETFVRLMTPEYASPEQIRGEPVTTATDIYSLGVLLFEMLTSQRPFQGNRTASEIEKAVCEETAVHASRIVSDSQIRSQLSGDIDLILAMSMRKEPERRYASVAAFREDISHYLEGQSVSARPDTFSYRATKWVRRKPFAAASVLLASVFLLGGFFLLASWYQRHQLKQADELLSRAQYLMQQDARTTSSSSLYPGIPQNYADAMSLLQQATQLLPDHAKSWTTLAEIAELSMEFDGKGSPELLQAGIHAATRATQIDPHDAKSWEIRAVIHTRQNLLDDALVDYAKAVELNPQSPYAVRGYSTLLHRKGDLSRALTVIDQALEGLPDPNNPDSRAVGVRGRAILLVHRGLLLHLSGQSEKALPSLNEAMDLDGSYRLTYWVAGLAHEAIGDYRQAEQDFRTGVRLAPQDPRPVSGLAHLLANTGRIKEAAQIEARLQSLLDHGRPVACELAIVRVAFQDPAGAFHWLEQIDEQTKLASCLIDPRLIPLQKDSRFQQQQSRADRVLNTSSENDLRTNGQ